MGNAFLRVSVLLQKNYNNINTMKDSPNEKKTYEPPQLTVVTFKMEQGFTASQFSIGRTPIDDMNEIYGMQDYQVENGQQWF